jgi:hypothetical protein
MCWIIVKRLELQLRHPMPPASFTRYPQKTMKMNQPVSFVWNPFESGIACRGPEIAEN